MDAGRFDEFGTAKCEKLVIRSLFSDYCLFLVLARGQYFLKSLFQIMSNEKR